MRTHPDYDYIVIGSNGFAQFGDPDQSKKDTAEGAILMPYIENLLPVPEEFVPYARYKYMRMPYEEGWYYEVVIFYHCTEVERWEEDEPEKHDRFYEWANKAECVDLETEELTELIKDYYLGKVIDIKKGEHLKILINKTA